MAKSLTLADLTDPREAAFVAAVLDLGGPQHIAEAARRAGYADGHDEAARIGAILIGAPRIRHALVGEVRERFDTFVPAALAALAEVCTDPKARASARIAAAQAILDRSSLGPVPSRSMSLTATTSIEDILDRIDQEDSRNLHDATALPGSP